VHPQCLGFIQNAKNAGVRFSAPTPGRAIDFGQLMRLRAELNRSGNALLWTWGYRSDVIALIILLTAWDTKIIGSLRSAAGQKITKFSWFWKVLSHTHCAFISNSRLNVQQVAQVASNMQRKSKVIYNAIEDKYFERPRAYRNRPAELRVIMLGNQTSYIKGYDIALQVAALIWEKKLPIKICIGGTPSDGVALGKSIHSLNLADVIRLNGSVSDVPAFLETGDIFMLLSRYEGTPNALIEAMSLGLPAVATRVGDLAEIGRDKIHLRLVDAEANSVFQALLELWHDWPETQRMASEGRELCRKRFNERLMIASTVSFLRGVVREEQVF